MDCRLSKELLKLYALGVISASDVQRLSKAAVDDHAQGYEDDLPIKLSEAGVSRYSGELHSGNVARAIRGAVASSGLLSHQAQPYVLNINDGKPLHIFLPHEVMYYLNRDNPEAWHLDLVTGSPHLLNLYSEWKSHPDVSLADDHISGMIVGMHWDGVQYSAGLRAGEGKSIFVCSFNVISATCKKKARKRFPLFVLQKERFCACGCQGYHTFQAIFDVIGWSFERLKVGISPSKRHDDSPFTSDDRKNRLCVGTVLPRGALLQIRCDWEGFVMAFRFRSPSSDSFCWLCDATKSGEMIYTNFSPDAPHRRSKMNHEDYLSACACQGENPLNIFRTPGLTLKHLAIDSMHSADLGIFQDFLGSIFWLEVHFKGLHANMAAGVKSLNRDLQSYYSSNFHRRLTSIGKLGMNMICCKSLGFPCLRAKAAQTRHLADFGLILANLHAHGSSGRPAFSFRRSHPLSGREGEHGALLVQCAGGDG